MITNKMRLKKYNLTEDQRNIIDSIKYQPEDEEYLKSQVRRYLKNNLPIVYLQKNWKDIVKLGRDSSSKRSYILRYGEELGTRLFNEKLAMSVVTKDDLIKKYGKKEATKRLSARGASLENYVARHGEKLGREKWQKYLDKRRRSFAQGRKEKRYASRNLSWFQDKYGEAEGYDVWDKKKKSQAYKISKAYYIEKYGEELGKKKCAESKSRSLKNFVKKYGEDEGLVRYNNWLNNVVSSLKGRNNYSVWATECCDDIKKTITDLHYYAENEMIWHLPKKYQVMLDQKIISPDLFYKGKVIEFHGDHFHGNPMLFEQNATPHPFDKKITVSELNKIDRLRKEYYESKGYQVMEIWENEAKLDKKGVIEKCLMFLK